MNLRGDAVADVFWGDAVRQIAEHDSAWSRLVRHLWLKITVDIESFLSKLDRCDRHQLKTPRTFDDSENELDYLHPLFKQLYRRRRLLLHNRERHSERISIGLGKSPFLF
jgi:hypothetical protein